MLHLLIKGEFHWMWDLNRKHGKWSGLVSFTDIKHVWDITIYVLYTGRVLNMAGSTIGAFKKVKNNKLTQNKLLKSPQISGGINISVNTRQKENTHRFTLGGDTVWSCKSTFNRKKEQERQKYRKKERKKGRQKDFP